MDNFGAGYFAGRRKERRRIARLLAGQGTAIPASRPWVTITGRGLRRLALALLVLIVALVLLFLVFAIVYGVRHHLIYMAG